MTLKQVIEALVFASPKPITTKEIVAALRAAGEGTEDQETKDFAAAKDGNVLEALAEVLHPGAFRFAHTQRFAAAIGANGF